MRNFLQAKLTYANVVSTLCLFLLLGGGAALAAGKLGKNTVGTKQLKKESVTAVKIKKAAITAAKLQDGSVSPGKLSGDAVTTGNLTDRAITSAQLADGAVTDSKLAAGSVGAGRLAPNSVTGIEIAPQSVSTADLAGVDFRGTIHGDAGAVAAHSCTTADIQLGGTEVGDALLLTFIGEVAVPAGLTFQLLKISSPDHGNIRFCNPTNAASPEFNNVGVRVIALR
jgi:hypothetical protein